MKWLARAVVTITFAAAAGAVHAQCAGFTDTSDDGTGPSAFCPNVQWVKNRGVTLGCTSLTLYCPTNNVTRLQMAAFMNRLGRALTPEVEVRQGSFGAAILPGPPPELALLRCITTNFSAATYPRQVAVTASISALADGNAAGVRAFLLVSTDAGASYSVFDNGVSVAQRATVAPNAWTNIALTEGLELAINTTYQFAIGVRRDDVGPVTTGNLAGTRCQLTSAIANLNGTSPPFDAQ